MGERLVLQNGSTGYYSSGESDYESDELSQESHLDGSIQNAFPSFTANSPTLAAEYDSQSAHQPQQNIYSVAIHLPRDISRPILIPAELKQSEKIIPIHNRSVKAFDTLLARIKRALELTRLTLDDCIKDLKMLDLDTNPACCKIRTRFITIIREALLQAQTRGSFFEEISMFIETEIQRVVSEYFPQSVDEFVYSNLKKIKKKMPMWFPMEPQTCLLCIDKVADCRLLPGYTDSFCRCKEMSVCLECMLRHYWQNSENNRKSFAVCPQCRGEFSLTSLIYVQYEAVKMPVAQVKHILQESDQQTEFVIPKSVTIVKRNPNRTHSAIRPMMPNYEGSHQQNLES